MICIQAKLVEGLDLAKEFNSNVQDLLIKMARCEETISDLPLPSLILETISNQQQEHKVSFFYAIYTFETDIYTLDMMQHYL